MIVNLHVTQKIQNEDGTTSIAFNASLPGNPARLQCSSIFLTIATVADTFEIGADYQGDLTKTTTTAVTEINVTQQL